MAFLGSVATLDLFCRVLWQREEVSPLQNPTHSKARCQVARMSLLMKTRRSRFMQSTCRCFYFRKCISINKQEIHWQKIYWRLHCFGVDGVDGVDGPGVWSDSGAARERWPPGCDFIRCAWGAYFWRGAKARLSRGNSFCFHWKDLKTNGPMAKPMAMSFTPSWTRRFILQCPYMFRQGLRMKPSATKDKFASASVFAYGFVEWWSNPSHIHRIEFLWNLAALLSRIPGTCERYLSLQLL